MVKAPHNYVFSKAGFPCPVSQYHAASVEFDPAIAPLIAALLYAGCPSDITGLIIAIVIDAVNRMPRTGALAYISQEGRGRFGPFLTDSYAAAAVKRKIASVWIGASLYDCHPIPVSWLLPDIHRRAP
jgi:hypothetical protein